MGEYEEGVDFELKIMMEMKLGGYLVIVEEFMKWGKRQGCAVGGGRGWGGGWLVGYWLKITDV
ncbi:hypothetical protein, partial [Neisseria sicca]|uniref:hypothetical protein n=1 Tax=Neisseria sicca TaxID=490 RepID=UPI0034D9748F